MADVKGPMLPPSRPVGREHTPQPSLLSGSDGPLLDDGRPRLSFSSTLPSVSSLPDLKKAGAKRPKFVARASQYLIGTYGKSKEPNYFADIELKRASEPVPLEQIINSLQHELLANPLKPLGVERNGSLLRILEGYVSLQKERDLLAGKLRETVKRHDRNVDILEDERKEWKQNKEIFKAEIKRFEIVVAEGRTGLSQVALARQQSLMRGRAKAIGRPRRSSSKSEAAKGYASTASSKSSKELKVQGTRLPLTLASKTNPR